MSKKVSPYQIFKITARKAFLVLQVRHIGSDGAPALEHLEAYFANRSIHSPWVKIPKGSVLLLTPEAARYMVAENTIQAMAQIDTAAVPS